MFTDYLTPLTVVAVYFLHIYRKKRYMLLLGADIVFIQKKLDRQTEILSAILAHEKSEITIDRMRQIADNTKKTADFSDLIYNNMPQSDLR